MKGLKDLCRYKALARPERSEGRQSVLDLIPSRYVDIYIIKGWRVSIAVRAGMNWAEFRTSRMSGVKLGNITGHSGVLDQLGYDGQKGKHAWRLLGNTLLVREQSWGAGKVCPCCIEANGTMEAHFDLALMIACPVHKCFLLNSCPECGEELSWYRPALLECTCGAELTKRERLPIASDLDCRLLDVIRAKVLQASLSPGPTFDMPAADLLRLDLQNLLYIVRVFGRYWALKNGYTSDQLTAGVLVSSAAQVISKWPTNFECMLRAVGGREHYKSRFAFNQLGKFYRAMLGRKSAEFRPRRQGRFLHEAFVKFVVNEWGERSASARFARSYLLPPRRRSTDCGDLFLDPICSTAGALTGPKAFL
jgi:hypothetical protein